MTSSTEQSKVGSNMINEFNKIGRIFNIQKFSLHDGPGIRTIVFLKGCFLRCQWCCNPESQKYDCEEMTTPDGPKIVGEDRRVFDILDEVEKDRSYYRRTGGGLTLSGGECLYQLEFSIALLKEAQTRGIHTAIETTGYAPFEKIEGVLPFVDVVLMDIKHTDDEKHQQFTGVSNEIILANAKKIAESETELIIRVPIIPTFNESVEEIRAIASFVVNLKSVSQLHLLPYHPLGIEKYHHLDRKYSLEHIKAPSQKWMAKLKEVASAVGLEVHIGG